MDRAKFSGIGPSEMAQLARMEKGSVRKTVAQGQAPVVPGAQILAFGSVYKCAACDSEIFVAETLVKVQFTDLAKTQAKLDAVGSRFKCAGCGVLADFGKKDEKKHEPDTAGNKNSD